MIEGIEALVPLLIPFILGLLLGVIVKKGFELILLVAATVLILSATGYISYGIGDLKAAAMKYLPNIIGKAQSKLALLPYSTPAFLVGLAIGLWRG